MKSVKYLILLVSIFAFSTSLAFAGCDGWFSFSSNCEVKPPYCQDGKCSLSGGIDAVGTAVNGLVTKTPISQYVQQVVSYFLAFVSLIAVIYIIYAGFQLMIGAGDEEKMKKTKNIILYVVVGILIMWLAFGIVKWAINLTKPVAGGINTSIAWSLVPEVSAYTESDADTFRDYQGKIRTAIENLEAELKVNGIVEAGSIQNIKSLVQAAYDRLPDNTEDAGNNATAKRAVDMYLDIAAKSPNSNAKVGDAISKVSTFIDGAKISSITGDFSTTPSEGNAPLVVSFQSTDVIDPSGTTPGSNNYIWWVRENGGVRREIGRGPSLVHTFTQEGTFTVNLDVISGSRNSKGKTDVLPLSVSKSISVKPKLGEIVLLVNGVNVSNLESIKINPTLGKMGIIFDATASRAIGNGTITKTTWDFGNGNDPISYEGRPIVERQIFSNQGNYTVQLKVTTNDGKEVSKSIRLIVRDPSAVIQLESDVGHVGEEVHMSALSYFTNNNNVEYSWQIQNDSNTKVLKSAAGNTLNYKFDTIGKYIVTLNARSPNGALDSDSRTITIESREPIVNLENPVSISSEKPNTFVFDASKSYDPDTMSKKGLTYTWRLDGQKVDLQNVTEDSARGTITFDSLGNHTMSLTIANAYGKVATAERSFTVDSILSVNMLVTPQVAPIGTNITFVGRSQNADFFEWNFGDGSSPLSGNDNIVYNAFKKTGVYNVSLTVSTKEGGKTNQLQRKVYATDTNSPFAIISVSNGSSSAHEDSNACGTGAIVVNRSEATTLDASKSVNVDGSNNDLSYTWSYFGKAKTTPNISEKFGELGCFPIKLTVRSNKNGSTHTTTQNLYLKNQAPELTSISTNVDTTKKDSQKVLVKVTANGAIDPDGVITSYIWYYTTESDKEPQNVQITQKSEITFVLPNITEKYYFGVILEDNDGARTNSAESSNEQAPLILNNQNGNIYLPLITLTTPKTTVLAGENVHLAVETKTIVGTVITNKAEYAWDFDGDGIIDQKTQNPSIDHVYQNSGNYTIKVRATYNGVSNTKYQTIYVKNALKAQVHGYRLPDGGLYLLNASQGSYDKAIWSVGGVSTESLYSTTIEPGTNIGNESIGTLTISSNNTDQDTGDIKLSDIEEVTGSGVHYQSSPSAQDDTIHVKGSSDKVLLSFLGNTASRYAIDTNTSIDSDLDGVPDNDADNKELASYTDGSVYVMKDFNTTRSHEQKIKVSLFERNTLVASKIITLIFDFVPATSSVSGEVLLDMGSGSISTFDKSKLDELSSLIRSIDDADRVVLMKGYNTLIENWDDSFAKSKSLIDIQTSVNDANIPTDKKESLTRVINDLLSGDSQATDDVTLAAKLIEGLVSKSPNAAVLSEKLIAIESHPQSLESNIVLAKEIFELIQTDSSIDDGTKQYIYNQLSVIKSGGSQSVPPETIQTPSSGGGVLGFIGGVVKIFFLIIGVILFVILIGYVLYRVSRKNDTIGFQDFLIDSVFHARKGSNNEAVINNTPANNTPSAQDKAPVVAEPVKPIDPMTAFVTQVNPEPSENVVSSSMPSSPEIIPPSTSATIVPTTDAPEASSGVPDWLKVPSNTSIPEEIIGTAAPSVIKEGSPVEKPVTIDEEISITPPVPTAPITSAIPDWLQGSTPVTPPTENKKDTELLEETQLIAPITELETPEPQGITTEVPSDSAIPSWLVDSIKTDAAPPVPIEEVIVTEEEPQKKGNKKKTEKKTESTKAPSGADKPAGDIPDWLK